MNRSTLEYKPSHVGYRQAGAVLLIGMIFLLILVVGGVALMNTSAQNEKATGNSKRSTDAFMAAEGGMQAVITNLDDRGLDDVDVPAWFRYTCVDGVLVDDAGGEYDPDDSDMPAYMAKTGFQGGSTYQVSYRGQCETKKGTADGMGSLRLVSEGRQGNSEREIHFNLGRGEASWPAVFVNEDPDNPYCNFDFGPSVAYEYDGKGGPAISTNSSTCRNSIADSDGGSGQLKGGVAVNNPAPDFTSPAGLERFYSELQASSATQKVRAAGKKGKGLEPIDLNDGKLLTDGGAAVELGVPGGTASDMRTVIVHGDVLMKGSLNGSGVLVITGTANFSGTPNWDGLIVVLGGQVSISGGGTKNGLGGSLIVSNIGYPGLTNENTVDALPESPTFTEWSESNNDTWYDDDEFDVSKKHSWDYSGSPIINWDVSGGGTARYTYRCENLQKVEQHLRANIGVHDLANLPGPDSCDIAGTGSGTFGSIRILDWYEHVRS